MNQHEMAASQYLSALEAKAAAEKSLANAKSFLVRAAGEAGTASIVVDGKAVVLTDAIRRNFSAETLRGMVPEAIYNACAKHSIDSRSFDRLVGTGSIDSATEAAVVTGTPYVRVNITDATEVAEAAPEVGGITKAEPF